MKKISPLKAIRKQCVQCMGGSFKMVEECPSIDCPLWEFRFGKDVRGSRVKAIRKFCLQCAGSAAEVKTCQGDKSVVPCPLYKFRFGKNPNISEETREKRKKAMAKRKMFLKTPNVTIV